jgi:hypothetical protein
VRRINVLAREQLIEARLRDRNRGRQRVAESGEAACADRDEQRLDRFDPCRKIAHALVNEIRSGLVHVFRDRTYPIPASRNARFSFSISRAITSRWIWFVPS